MNLSSDCNNFYLDDDGDLIFQGTRPKDLDAAFLLVAEKWAFLRKCAFLKQPVRERGTSTCGFCMLFFRDDQDIETVCYACPIYTSSNKRFCMGTPYITYCELNHDWEPHPHYWDLKEQAAHSMVQFVAGAYKLHKEQK